MWETNEACIKVLERMKKEYHKAPKCEICEKIAFDCNSRTLEYVYYLETHRRKIDRSMYDTIINYVYKYYPYQDYGNLTRHHISYKKKVCMLVCSSCHAKIHNSNDPKYKKYYPIDKRPKNLNKIKFEVYKTL